MIRITIKLRIPAVAQWVKGSGIATAVVWVAAVTQVAAVARIGSLAQNHMLRVQPLKKTKQNKQKTITVEHKCNRRSCICFVLNKLNMLQVF